MARKWSGFLPQNFSAKEEWELLESCEAQARHLEEMQARFRTVKAPADPAEPSRPAGRAHKSKRLG